MYKVPHADAHKPLRDRYAQHYLTNAHLSRVYIVIWLILMLIAFIYSIQNSPNESWWFVVGALVLGPLVGMILGFIVGLLAAVVCRMSPLAWLKLPNFPIIVAGLVGLVSLIALWLINASILQILVISIVNAGWIWWRGQRLPAEVQINNVVIPPFE